MSKKYLAVHPLTFIPNHSASLENSLLDERNLAFVKVLEPDDLLYERGKPLCHARGTEPLYFG